MSIYTFLTKLYKLFRTKNTNKNSNDWHHTHKKGDIYFFDSTTHQIRSINIS